MREMNAKLTVAVIGKLNGELTAFDDQRPASRCCSAGCTSPGPPRAWSRPSPSPTHVAFDLLWQARSLLRSPYAQRRALLDGLGLAAEHVSVPLTFPAARALVNAKLRDLGLEGVVLKTALLRLQARPAEQRIWLKIRHLTAADVLIGVQAVAVAAVREPSQ